jgi:non-ribosomal peptide synthetase component F
MGAPELMALPTDHPRPQVQSFRGDIYEYSLPREVTAAVSELKAAIGCSLYTICLAAYKVVLSLYSKEEDIIVGSSCATRPGLTTDLIGYMVNVLAIRSNISLDTSFKQLIQQEKVALLEAMAHADVPLANVVAALGIKRTSAYTPLVQAMMTSYEMGKDVDMLSCFR